MARPPPQYTRLKDKLWELLPGGLEGLCTGKLPSGETGCGSDGTLCCSEVCQNNLCINPGFPPEEAACAGIYVPFSD